MDDVEIERLRKKILRAFGSSPHKKRYWLALLEIYVGAAKKTSGVGKKAPVKSAGAAAAAQRN